MNKLLILPTIFLITVVACHRKNEWQEVKYDVNLKCGTLGTECITTHQGEHVLEKCDVYMDNDTLFIDFPAQLPAYWGYLTIKVHNNRFNAQFDGIPFIPETVTFETKKAGLALAKNRYAINDTICGYCDFSFKSTFSKTGHSDTFYFRGTISEIVRDKDFDPFESKNFMTFDLPTALREIGEPLSRETFSTYGLHEFRIELRNYFPASKDIIITELTWDSSDIRDISDGGIERLTIWYVEKNGTWQPVHYTEWTTEMQF